MRKKMNAFTLIELLAVIVILAIIALIATPIILGIVEDAKKDAFLRSVELVISTTDLDIANKTFEEEYTYTITDGDISNMEVSIKNTKGMNGSITYDINGNESYAIHNGVYCVIKTEEMNKVEISDYKEGECIIPPVLTESDISFITFNDLEYTYDGTEKEIVVNNLSDEFNVTYANNKGTNVGSYNATAVITGKNYRGSITKEATLTIQKASITLKAEDKTSKYGEDFVELTYQVVLGTIYGNDDLNIDLIKEDGTEIGNYNIILNAENTNYEIILVNGIYTITVGFTSESCFAFSNGSITNYYDYESNDSSNKECPRDVIIPETINGITVTSIGWSAFEEKNITSVQFPSTITSIGSSAFGYNLITDELDLSNTQVTVIDRSVFTNNQITSIKLPSTLTTIMTNAFKDNRLKGELDLSNTKLTTIDSYAFHGKSDGSTNQITSVKFPTTLTKIAYQAFKYNAISGELDLSNLSKLTYVGGFSSNKLTSVKFPTSVTNISDFNENTIIGNLDLEDLINLISIGTDGFDNNQITGVKFPNTLTSIGYRAFRRNKITGELDLSNTQLTSIGELAFEGSSTGNQITSIAFPETLTTIAEKAFYSNAITGELNLSNLNNLTTVGKSAFRFNKIEIINFSKTIANIADYSFGSNNLTSVTFYGRSDLTGVTVGSNAWGWADGYSDANIYFVNE